MYKKLTGKKKIEILPKKESINKIKKDHHLKFIDLSFLKLIIFVAYILVQFLFQ